MLSPAPKLRPRPFEMIFEAPQAAPLLLQPAAMMAALRTILEAYRLFIVYAANL